MKHLLFLPLLLISISLSAQSHSCYSKEVDYKSSQQLFSLQNEYDVSTSQLQYISPNEPYEGDLTLNAGERAVICLVTEKEADKVTITISKPDGSKMTDVKLEKPEHNVGILYFKATESGTYIINCTVSRSSGFHSCSAVLSGKALN